MVTSEQQQRASLHLTESLTAVMNLVMTAADDPDEALAQITGVASIACGMVKEAIKPTGAELTDTILQLTKEARLALRSFNTAMVEIQSNGTPT